MKRIFGWVLLFFFLIVIRNAGFFGYWLRFPRAFATASIVSICRDALSPLFAGFLIGFLAWALGRRLFLWTVGDSPGLASGAAGIFAFGLGIGAIAFGVFFLGLAGKLDSFGLLGLGIATTVLAATHPKLASSRSPARRAGPGFISTVFEKFCWVILLLAGWHVLILALAPPTEWDVLAYHLVLPKLYVSAGRIYEIPWMIHSHWPHLMETLYCVPVMLRMDNMAALLHAALCVAWLCAIFLFGKQYLGARAAWMATILTATQPLVLRFAGSAHSDGGLALFYFLGVISLWRWFESRSARWAALGGIFFGLAASCKLLGLIPVAAMILWIFWQSLRSGTSHRWKAPILFACCALGLVGPWYIKTFLSTGNPFWPFLPKIFGGQYGGPEIVLPYVQSNSWSRPSADILLQNAAFLLLLPLALSIGIAAFRRSPWPAFLKFLWFPIPIYYPFIARNHEFWRFLLPFYPCITLTIGWVISELIDAGQKARYSPWGSLVLAASMCLFGASEIFRTSENNQLFPVLGLQSKERPDKDTRTVYLERSFEPYDFFARVNGLLSANKVKILLFREIRGYYLDVPYQWGDPVNQGLIRYSSLSKPADLRARLAELGITHVLVNDMLGMYQPGVTYYNRGTVRLMDDMLRQDGRVLLRGNGLTLYRLQP